MKRKGCLNSELSYVISKLGHGDKLTISDLGLPVANGVIRIDLAVTQDVPRFSDVFDVVTQEAYFQKVYIALEAKNENKEFYETVLKWAKDNKVEVEELPIGEFKKDSEKSVAVVRTGAHAPYSNIILEAGFPFN